MTSPVRAPLPASGPDGEPPRARLVLPVVCLITDRTLAPDGDLLRVVAEAVAGGVTMVQLREKDLPTHELLDLATRLRAVVEPPAVLLVNGRADVAFAAQADGVHLPSDGLPVEGARLTLGAHAIVGRAIHSAEEAHAATAEPLDYLELGTIFPSRSHPGGGVVGTGEIQAARSCGRPIVAVGGVTNETAAQVIAAGASGVAVISAILGATSPRDAALRLSSAVLESWERRGSPNGAH